jgi:hypothetical protein
MARIDERRSARAWGCDGGALLPADLERFASTPRKDRELVVLGPIALAAGIEVVAPGEDPLRVEALGPDVLDLVRGRVLAVPTALGTRAHVRQLPTDLGEGPVVPRVVLLEEPLSGGDPGGVVRQRIHLGLPMRELTHRGGGRRQVRQLNHFEPL